MYGPLIKEEVLRGTWFVGDEFSVACGHGVDNAEDGYHNEIDMSLGVDATVFVATVASVRLAVMVVVVDSRNLDVPLVLHRPHRPS